jgi:hypothetical protein
VCKGFLTITKENKLQGINNYNGKLLQGRKKVGVGRGEKEYNQGRR